ncbi:hypothetical protein FH972_025163 [Carpinus fangiana]|uniref:Uncharacterized protein n=1 Tax=Carpinus fangiana TaxID=176857 RepID=A0A5N6L0G5_9ROSI|nr:hypothetical protein FH972_025163 [Carpinus fangiana]
MAALTLARPRVSICSHYLKRIHPLTLDNSQAVLSLPGPWPRSGRLPYTET